MERSPELSRRSVLAGLAGASLSVSLVGCGARGPSINFCNWDSYIGKTTLADFKKATGVNVSTSLISSNGEVFAKLREGNQGYDVIIASSDFVARMIKAGMLMKLDRRRIPNFRNVDPRYQDAGYDPGRVYSMPYTLVTIGIGYRKSKVSGVPDSWKWLLDSDRYKGRIGLSSDAGELCRVALTYLGYDPNTTDPRALDAVQKLLLRQKPNVSVFHDDNGQDLLLSGDVDLVMEYNGDIAGVMREDHDLGFVVPREGSMRSADCMCIPAGSRHPDLANAFINYLLDARAGAEIASTVHYTTPNAAAAALMSADYRNNPAIFPPQSILNKCHYPDYLGEKAQGTYEEILTRVRAA